MKDISPDVKAMVKRLEPLVYTQEEVENKLNSTFSEKWWGWADNVRTYFLQNECIIKVAEK